MKEYNKPFIQDEEILIEDVIAISNGGDTDASDGFKIPSTDLW